MSVKEASISDHLTTMSLPFQPSEKVIRRWKLPEFLHFMKRNNPLKNAGNEDELTTVLPQSPSFGTMSGQVYFFCPHARIYAPHLLNK